MPGWSQPFSNALEGKGVRISFDLDDTLICGTAVPVEQYVAWWRRWRYPERLRCGTRALMAALVQRRCRIWLYTSSSRSPHYLKSWFASFGIVIEGVVNKSRHERLLGVRGPSKFPPAFGIDLHIDDSPGVALEGEDHRFAVLVVAPDDLGWTERILQEVDARISANARWQARRSLPQSSVFGLGSVVWRSLLHSGLEDCPLPYYAIDFAEPDSA